MSTLSLYLCSLNSHSAKVLQLMNERKRYQQVAQHAFVVYKEWIFSDLQIILLILNAYGNNVFGRCLQQKPLSFLLSDEICSVFIRTKALSGSPTLSAYLESQKPHLTSARGSQSNGVTSQHEFVTEITKHFVFFLHWIVLHVLWDARKLYIYLYGTEPFIILCSHVAYYQF